jgi:hypothetical protein
MELLPLFDCVPYLFIGLVEIDHFAMSTIKSETIQSLKEAKKCVSGDVG